MLWIFKKSTWTTTGWLGGGSIFWNQLSNLKILRIRTLKNTKFLIWSEKRFKYFGTAIMNFLGASAGLLDTMTRLKVMFYHTPGGLPRCSYLDPLWVGWNKIIELIIRNKRKLRGRPRGRAWIWLGGGQGRRGTGGLDHWQHGPSHGGLVRCHPQGYYGVWYQWGRSRNS